MFRQGPSTVKEHLPKRLSHIPLCCQDRRDTGPLVFFTSHLLLNHHVFEVFEFEETAGGAVEIDGNEIDLPVGVVVNSFVQNVGLNNPLQPLPFPRVDVIFGFIIFGAEMISRNGLHLDKMDHLVFLGHNVYFAPFAPVVPLQNFEALAN